MRPGPLLAALAMLGVGALLFAPQGGCTSACDTSGQDAIVYTAGERVGSGYETTPVDGTWIEFPAGRRYRLMHGLGTMHYAELAYLSFDAHPAPDDPIGVGNYSEGAGNEAIFENHTAESVQVRNDTCADYYLHVVLIPYGPTSSTDAGAD